MLRSALTPPQNLYMIAGMHNITYILDHWDITWQQDHADLDITGSPERTISRRTFSDNSGDLYILEQLDPANVLRKTQIAKDIACLHRHGFNMVTPYLPTKNNECVARTDDNYWLLRPYIPGCPLDRETYANDAWRGEALADLLLQLHQTQQHLPELGTPETFPLPGYISTVLPKLERRTPGITQQLQPVLRFLQQTLDPVYNQLPTAFCHGDCHPLNVIWGNRTINTIIDWEFCGHKPELYDLALLLGCIGFDDPENLTRPLTTSLVRKLKDSRCLQNSSWDNLVPLMTGIRMAWLREWVFRQEHDAIKQELLYMQILTIFHHQNSFAVQ